MKYLLIICIALAVAFGFMMKHNNDKRAAAIAAEQIKQAEKQRSKKIDELKKDGLTEDTAQKLLLTNATVDKNQINEIVRTLGRWVDAVKLASSSPRFALTQPISELQGIRRDFASKEYTDECSKVLQTSVITYMDYGLDSFIEFLKDNEYAADRNLNNAVEEQKNVQAVIHYCEMNL